ncbi:MAG TPA: hypothetical protein VMD77_14355 [Candidatus Baltobacteraceae bacterium]|nr:hypothetical protein [Candidatus Baltobacteraceae bacterium]
MDCVDIGPKAVRGDLESSRCGFVQFFDKSIRVSRRATAKVPRKNQFCVAFDGDEAVSIAALRVASEIVFFFAADEAPQFIALDFADRNGADSTFEKTFTFFAYQNEQRQNRGVVNSRDALDRADRTALDQQFDNSNCPVQWRVHRAERSSAFLCESLAALAAAEALKSVPVLPKLFAFGTAIVASHVSFSLVFLREKPDNHDLGSDCGLRPPLDSAVPSVSADGTAFFFLLYAPPSRPCGHHVHGEQTFGNPGDFDSFYQAVENCIQRRHRVAVSRQIVALLNQSVANLRRAEFNSPVHSEDRANSICESQHLDIVRIENSAEALKIRDDLLCMFDLRSDSFAVHIQFSQPGLKPSQFRTIGCELNLVVFRSHHIPQTRSVYITLKYHV